MSVSRRDFLRASAAASAVIAAGLPVPVNASNVTTDSELTRLKWSKAPCRFCGTGCGVRVAVKEGKVVATHGASAANALGLTRQVPIREVYVTSGRTRKLKLGCSEVLVKHVPRWMLVLGPGPAGAAVRALAWMGPTHADESLATLRKTLPASEWRALASSRAALPSWMARAIGEEAARG